MMADQPAPETVLDQPGIAVRAAQSKPATAAQRQRGVAPPIEKEQRLLARFDAHSHRLSEPRRNESSARRLLGAVRLLAIRGVEEVLVAQVEPQRQQIQGLKLHPRQRVPLPLPVDSAERLRKNTHRQRPAHLRPLLPCRDRFPLKVHYPERGSLLRTCVR